MNAPIQSSPLVTEPTPPGAAAPWETLASPGHVLFHRASLLGARVGRLTRNLIVAICLLLAALSVVAAMRDGEAHFVTSLADRVQGWTASGTLAPIVGTPHASWHGLTPEQAAALSTPNDVSTWLQSQTEAVSGGAPPQGCADLKLTAAWPFNAIGCRTSADRSRTWVWGLSRVESTPGLIQIQPVFVVYRRAVWSDGAPASWQLRAVDAPGQPALAGIQAVRWADVPRAAASDFPELAARAAN